MRKKRRIIAPYHGACKRRAVWKGVNYNWINKRTFGWMETTNCQTLILLFSSSLPVMIATNLNFSFSFFCRFGSRIDGLSGEKWSGKNKKEFENFKRTTRTSPAIAITLHRVRITQTQILFITIHPTSQTNLIWRLHKFFKASQGLIVNLVAVLKKLLTSERNSKFFVNFTEKKNWKC